MSPNMGIAQTGACSSMTVFLNGIAAQFYKGIGAEAQFIAPFSRMNFFIGANNSGKSIVLSLLAEQLLQIRSDTRIKPLLGPDVHTAQETGPFVIAVGHRAEVLSEKIIQKYAGRHFQSLSGGYPQPTFQSEVQKVLQRLTISGHVWCVSKESNRIEFYPLVDIETAKHWTTEWRALWSLVTQSSGGGLQNWIAGTLSVLSQNLMPSLPNIHLIPAKRALGKKDEKFDDLSGKGLIDHLATLQNPSWNRQEEGENFKKINKFLQDVTGKAEARLEVPNDKEHLSVHMDNKVLPLSSLGTGIHEVILIAAFCTINDKTMMCIEEPEIHLHPMLQKKLINYLIANTESQYFIATHSAAFIDTPNASIFRVTNDGVQTRIKAVLSKGDKREILDDLGYQASDILQANAVVWVEGPSDRIYLNHWITSADSTLKEGIHYTIMFYGGALISHLSASDEAIDEFIKLRDLNRNMAIIIDSDRDAASADLKPHAQRLLEEMNVDGGLVWITAGREMENYITGSQLQNAIREVHPKLFIAEGPTGQYDHSFYFYRENQKKAGQKEMFKSADKVGIATKICKTEARLDILDLKERIDALIRMVRKANATSAN